MGRPTTTQRHHRRCLRHRRRPACAIARTELDGVCTSVSPFFEPVELPLLDMYTNGVHLITGRPHVRNLVPEIVGAIDRGTFDPSTVPPTQVPWDDALDALTDPPDKLVLVR